MKFQVIYTFALLSFTNGLLAPPQYADNGVGSLIKTVGSIALKTIKAGEAILMIDPIDPAIEQPTSG